MKNWDLYKIIIVVSLVLMPVAGYWWWTIEERIDVGNEAIQKERTATGYLTQIGARLSEWETISRNEAKTRNIQDARVFFDKMIVNSASMGSISPSEYTLDNSTKNARGVTKAEDVSVSIKFDIEELPREYVSTLLRNVEGQAPVWRLNVLKMTNVEAKSSSSNAPPDELRDMWKVDRLEFIRRQGQS